MLLKYFYDRTLAQASYLVGCQATGEAIVIDPARDIEPYLEAAAQEGVRIVAAAETHIHADFVSGSRELAARAGARLYLSDMGGSEWAYAFAGPNDVLLREGSTFMIGNLRFEALHTPGHTPEHIIYQLTDTAAADRPMGLFTGDCLFVGDVGRPDLLETAVGMFGSAEVGARGQFANVERLRAMPDYLQVWPGHGAGSACGKALGAVPSSTLGYEKLFNAAFQFDDEKAFVRWLLDGQPETPRYFAQMKKVNREGPTLLDDLPPIETLEGFILPDLLCQRLLVIDARSADEFAYAHIPGTLNIPPSSSFNTYAGWFVRYDEPTYLIAPEAAVPVLVKQLRAIGVDYIPGYFPPSQVEGLTETLPVISACEAAERLANSDAILLDVRAHSEYLSQRIDGARNIMYGVLPRYLDELPKDMPIIVLCASGARSQIAASLLQMHGFQEVMNVAGGLNAWLEAGLPVIEGMGEGRPNAG
ncbi:MAG: rhodanese-like domain-containing protein [Aggregatilineales bacterium]